MDHIRKEQLVKPENIGELVKRAQKNDAIAQKLLYEINIQEMLMLSYRMLPNLEDSKDIIQESFITAFRKIGSLKDPEKFKPWLKRIVINNCLKKKSKTIFHSVLEENIDYSDEPNEDWYSKLSSELVNEEIVNLPVGCKRILTLYLFENYKHKEIAAIMNISESTSKSQYRRALRLLKDKFKKILA